MSTFYVFEMRWHGGDMYCHTPETYAAIFPNKLPEHTYSLNSQDLTDSIREAIATTQERMVVEAELAVVEAELATARREYQEAKRLVLDYELFNPEYADS